MGYFMVKGLIHTKAVERELVSLEKVKNGTLKVMTKKGN